MISAALVSNSLNPRIFKLPKKSLTYCACPESACVAVKELGRPLSDIRFDTVAVTFDPFSCLSVMCDLFNIVFLFDSQQTKTIFRDRSSFSSRKVNAISYHGGLLQLVNSWDMQMANTPLGK